MPGITPSRSSEVTFQPSKEPLKKEVQAVSDTTADVALQAISHIKESQSNIGKATLKQAGYSVTKGEIERK